MSRDITSVEAMGLDHPQYFRNSEGGFNRSSQRFGE